MCPFVKNNEVDPRPRPPGERLKSACRPMPTFAYRPFPPPALADVPVEYIIDQLHNLAPLYWNKPDTADCTIIIPIPHPTGRPTNLSDPAEPMATAGFSFRTGSSNLGRRVTEPNLQTLPRISLQLHMDYLSAQSTFLRGLFSGASPLDLISSTVPTTSTPEYEATQNPHTQPSGPFHVPPSRLPRLLPSSPTHPIIFLPVPDPTSIHLLMHWMYFGRTDFIEQALTHGVVHWEGLARNVEYLGLAPEIKVFLGQWYSAWLQTERSDSEDDDEGDDDDDDEESAEISDDIAWLRLSGDDREEGEPERGRTRATRPISHTSSTTSSSPSPSLLRPRST